MKPIDPTLADPHLREGAAKPLGSPAHDGEAANRAPTTVDGREHRLFRAVDFENKQRVYRSDLERILEQTGLRRDDPRLAESMDSLVAYAPPEPRDTEPQVSEDQFCKAIRHNILLIERAIQGNLVIPDFSDFCREIDAIYKQARNNRAGRPAAYIPQLDLREPDVDQFGVALCTIDGQRFAAGQAHKFFSVQSCSKPINYCLALEEHGEDAVHRHVGREPSGQSFNELSLDRRSRPHNPMINAGAIMSCALVRLKDKLEKARAGGLGNADMRSWVGERFDYALARWETLCGGQRPRFNNAVYLSERQTADRNFALGYFMRENGAFPEGADLHDVLDFYFQCCSIELNAEMMAVVAATLANGGICPVSGERVFRTETVQHCLSLMSACGMYDFSGEFAFTVGLPAKSGVSGAVMIVIPNVMGICSWSPRLDENGNSVRGIEFCQRLVQTFNFHHYANLGGVAGKRDPRLNRIEQKARQVNQLIWAASKGDLGAIQESVGKGTALNGADYDRRTPLHLAAAEGQLNVVQFFIDQHKQGAVDLSPRDRWGGTPLDDAYLHGHRKIAALLESAGAIRGQSGTANAQVLQRHAISRHLKADQTDELIWAASLGDLTHIRRLVARGVQLECADYDLRTSLHLAASEGHVAVVRYLLNHRVDRAPHDRWDGTPLADAQRHGHAEVAELLANERVRSAEDEDDAPTSVAA